MATWDASLPQSPLNRGYSEESPDNLIRTNMDTGADKVRRRTTSGVRKYKMSFLMSKAQVATLETFYHTTTNGGADKFTFDDPRTGVTSANYRFTGSPKYSSMNGDFYQVAIGMELLP